VNPLLHKWEAALQSGDNVKAFDLYGEVSSILEQAKRLNADEIATVTAWLRMHRLALQTRAALKAEAERFRQMTLDR